MAEITAQELALLDDPVDPKLKSARHLRRVKPRCCGTCTHFKIVDGFGLCRREGGFSGDAGDMYQWYSICDLYVGDES